MVKNFGVIKTECEHRLSNDGCGINSSLRCSLDNCKIVSKKLKEDIQRMAQNKKPIEDKGHKVLPKDAPQYPASAKRIASVKDINDVEDLVKSLEINLRWDMSDKDVIKEITVKHNALTNIVGMILKDLKG